MIPYGIVQAPGPYCYRCPYGLTYPSCDLHCAKDVEEVIKTSTSGQIAGMLAETIQGLGGFIVPPPGYFKIVANIVRNYGGLFIADEVQAAGAARARNGGASSTGKWSRTSSPPPKAWPTACPSA